MVHSACICLQLLTAQVHSPGRPNWVTNMLAQVAYSSLLTVVGQIRGPQCMLLPAGPGEPGSWPAVHASACRKWRVRFMACSAVHAFPCRW